MHRTRALLNTVLSALSYRNGGNLVLNAGVPIRHFAVAAADATAPGHSAEDSAKIKKVEEAVDASGAPIQQPLERRPLRFGTLQFLLQRRMPINSVRLLTSGVRLALDERCADDMVPYLGPWMTQLTRPEMLERTMPWSITDILRDLLRLARTVGIANVRDALPSKHLQTLANRLVVQGFDKLTPLQLARAADAFASFRPFVRNIRLDHAALDAGNEDAPPTVDVWPSSDWVDELIDWLHNLKPNAEPWDRTSCYVLSVILLGLSRSNYKPRQPTLQAAATSMKAKLEEQLKTGYLSRRSLSNSAISWNIWRVNPDEYAPGYWDVHFKSVAQVMEEYVDTAPDPPFVEDDIEPEATGDEKGEKERRARLPRNSPSLMSKRRELRTLLGTVALAAKNFNLNKQFNEQLKPIWEKRLEEHAQFLSGINARRIVSATDGLDISIKPQTRDKLIELSSRYGKRQNAPQEDRDIDEFDDLRGSARAERGGGGGVSPARGRAVRENVFDDYDDFQSDKRADAGKAQAGGRGGGRARRGEDLGFDDKQF